MLSCEDCEKYLEAFLDQALEVKESLDMHEHLRACLACTERVEAERIFRGFVRQQATAPPLLNEIKRQMIRQAMVPPVRLGWWVRLRSWVHPRDFALGMATAAMVWLWLFGLFPFQGDDMTQKFVQEASMMYQANKNKPMPLEVKASNDKTVVEWFNRRMDRPLEVPCITDQSTKLLGGRLCRLFDRKSATLVYKRNGANIFLFAFHGKGVSLSAKPKVRIRNQDVYVQHSAGQPVVVWQRGGIVYSMVGDLNRDDLLQVASTMHYR